MIIVIWNRTGWLVVPIGVICLCIFGRSVFHQGPSGGKPDVFAPLVGLIPGGFLLGVLGLILNSPMKLTDDDAHASRFHPISYTGHTLYFVKMEWWGLFFITAGIVSSIGIDSLIKWVAG